MHAPFEQGVRQQASLRSQAWYLQQEMPYMAMHKLRHAIGDIQQKSGGQAGRLAEHARCCPWQDWLLLLTGWAGVIAHAGAHCQHIDAAKHIVC